MLYAYCYLSIWFEQQVDKAEDFHKNSLWIKEHGPYKGHDK